MIFFPTAIATFTGIEERKKTVTRKKERKESRKKGREEEKEEESKDNEKKENKRRIQSQNEKFPDR